MHNYYENLFRFVKPGFVNPGLLDRTDISIEMTFPVDNKFFDQYPLIYDVAKRFKSLSTLERCI